MPHAMSNPLNPWWYCKCPMKCECSWGFNQEMVCLGKSFYITWTGWLIVVRGKKLLNFNPEKKKGNWSTNIPDILMMIIPLSLILATLGSFSICKTWTSHPSSKWPTSTYHFASNKCHAQKHMQPVGALLLISGLKKHKGVANSTLATENRHQNIATSTSPFSPSEKSPPSLSANHQLQTCQKYEFVMSQRRNPCETIQQIWGGRCMWVVLQKLEIAKLTGTNMRGGEIGG